MPAKTRAAVDSGEQQRPRAEYRDVEAGSDAWEGTRSRPLLALGAAIAAAFVAYSVLAELATAPRFFDDELIYWKAGASLASGHGLDVRGAPYGLGIAALYPALLAPILWLAPGREVAYELAKTLNALLFSLAAVPFYLLARRLLPPWPSVAAAALSIAVPSAMYVSVIMTESVAYLAAVSAFCVFALTLERPTSGRQLASLLAIGVAAAARLQLVVLLPVYVLALVLLVLLAPRGARRARVREYWPTALVLGAGALVAASSSLAAGGRAEGVLGRYTALWVTYSPWEVSSQTVHHLANLELYLAVIPLVIAPAAFVSLLSRARLGSRAHAAFACLFVAATASFLLLAAALDSSKYSLDRLHDRYDFYVVPLWFVLLLVWAQEGAPRGPRWAPIVGVAAAVCLVLAYPLGDLEVREGGRLFDGVATTLWAVVRNAGGDAFVRASLLVFALAAAACAFGGRTRGRRAIVFVTWVLVANTALVWGVGIRDARQSQKAVFAGGIGDRDWIDDRVPAGASVATLFSPYCGGANVPRRSLYQTEFFNSSVDRAVHVGSGYSYSLKSSPFHVGTEGTVLLPDGTPLITDYLVAQPGVRVAGREIASGTLARLGLWQVDGRVRIAGARSAPDVARQVCSMHSTS